MEATLINLGLAFIEGLALIISPCILPILPIILTGSLTGNKNKPLGIITGFLLTFCLLTLFIRSVVSLTNLSPELIRNAAFFILLMIGIIMISSYLTEKFTLLTQRFMSVGNKLLPNPDEQSGFWQGILFGALIGIVWTPCAGPIFAAVIVQVSLQETTFISLLTLISFAIGVGIPMLLIAYTGNRLMNKLTIFKRYAPLFRKLLGAIIIVSVTYLYFPNSFSSNSNNNEQTAFMGNELVNGLIEPYPAPAIADIESWINSPPLSIADLKGKVVLIDFWTYSCINCIRTLPYLKEWYQKYHDKGLVIIGIHSPEFEFEKNLENVRTAVKDFGIHYPVALDNHFATWRNFKNSYWPAHYLINKEGMVVYEHFGEGEYDTTENNIRFLLGINGSAKPQHAEESHGPQTPEIYLGYTRASQYGNLEPAIKDIPADYRYPITLQNDTWALNGKWTLHSENIVANNAGSSLKLHFYAKNVFAVLATSGLPVTIDIKLNGKLIKNLSITNSQLYTLLKQSEAAEGMLEIISKQPGLEVYTFTFG